MPPLNERLSEPKPESPLQELRRTIDAIDDRILALVEERLTAAKKVVGLKSAAAPGLIKYRPSRESEVVSRLTKQARATPPALVWYPPSSWQAGDAVHLTTLPLYLPRTWGVALRSKF